jgi:hypothetical protein
MNGQQSKGKLPVVQRRRTDLLLAGFIISVFALLVIAGCASGNGGSSAQEHAGHGSGGTSDVVNTDLLEKTPSPDVMPKFLSNYTKHTSDLYALAPKYEDILKQINCYCGCMEEYAHDSLFRCYIAGREGDQITWSDHSANCGTCKMELEDIVKMADQGKSVDEIKTAIDAKFKPSSN